jgi:hypothetical protein
MIRQYSAVEASKTGHSQAALGAEAPVGSGGYSQRGNWVARLLEIFQLSERLKGKERGVGRVLLGAQKGIAFWR